MATTTQKYQIIQKVSAEDNILIHPETDADIVKYDNTTSQLNATDVKGAIDELKENIDTITGGGTVTGVKGEAEETYRSGQVNITRANIGLGNVDNTSDMNKPVSTAQQAAIDDAIDGLSSTYIPASQKGTPNGVAGLDSTGKVPAAQLPSYVDDVVEYANRSSFPVIGEDGKIYVALDTNLTYRWGGSEYVEISPSLALGETAETAYAGNKGKANADAIAALQAAQGNYQTKTDNSLPTTSKTVVGAIGEVKGTADSAASAAAANAEAIADLEDGGEIPFPIRQRIDVYAALEEEAALLSQPRKRVLEAVEYLREEAGPELYGEHLASELDLIADCDAACHLIDLHGGHAIGDPDDLAFEAGIAYMDIADLVLYYLACEPDVDHVAIDAGHIALACRFHILSLSLSENIRFDGPIEPVELRGSLFLAER